MARDGYANLTVGTAALDALNRLQWALQTATNRRWTRSETLIFAANVALPDKPVASLPVSGNDQAAPVDSSGVVADRECGD
jgi:hypothetical protein